MGTKGLSFSVLFKKEDDIIIAHCLELDIVATADTFKEAENDILDLIAAQVSYAFSNDNLENLYHPAPSEVWQQYLTCKEIFSIKQHPVIAPKKKTQNIPPPFITAEMCDIQHHCSAN